jgi:ketosteroid isomerase-like protein
MPVSTDDYVSISDFLGRYCWLVDAGDEEGWAALWSEDGVFAGVMPEPVVGREALKGIPRGAYASSGGKLRHHVGSLNCDYEAGSKDVAIARYYNLVTNWVNGGAFTCNAASTVRLLRHGDSWLITRSDSVNLV